VWRPRFLISVISADDRINQVKHVDFGQILVNQGHHLEILANITNDPLKQVNTPLWSTLGQTLVKSWSKPLLSLSPPRTFAAFSNFHLNTSKSANIKVVHLLEGHTIHSWWHLKFWVEIAQKCGQLQSSNIHRRQESVVWTSLGPLPRWVPGLTTRWAPGTTRLVPHGTWWRGAQGHGGEVPG
jgi:hypothetical protein